MAKSTAVAADPVSAGVPLTLTEFCTRLSQTERRVELIGAFEFDERSAGRLKDTAEQYGARFQAFITKPV
ncbi:hypothetical protein D3C76_1597670 [compost metagenome]